LKIEPKKRATRFAPLFLRSPGEIIRPFGFYFRFLSWPVGGIVFSCGEAYAGVRPRKEGVWQRLKSKLKNVRIPVAIVRLQRTANIAERTARVLPNGRLLLAAAATRNVQLPSIDSYEASFYALDGVKTRSDPNIAGGDLFIQDQFEMVTASRRTGSCTWRCTTSSASGAAADNAARGRNASRARRIISRSFKKIRPSVPTRGSLKDCTTGAESRIRTRLLDFTAAGRWSSATKADGDGGWRTRAFG
jgi:hypothetical protein